MATTRSEVSIWTPMEARSEGRMKPGENCSYSSHTWLCSSHYSALHHSAWTPRSLLPAADTEIINNLHRRVTWSTAVGIDGCLAFHHKDQIQRLCIFPLNNKRGLGSQKVTFVLLLRLYTQQQLYFQRLKYYCTCLFFFFKFNVKFLCLQDRQTASDFCIRNKHSSSLVQLWKKV